MKKICTDYVIIGGGGCGVASAITAAESGLNVILLEKNSSLGGMTKFCEGMFAVGTKQQREMKLPYTVEDRFKAHMDESKWLANPRLVRILIERSAETIEWLESMGCEFTGVVSFYPGAPFVWHTIKARSDEDGKHGNGAPATYGMLRLMYNRMETLSNITVMTKTTATKILRENNGPVTGVMAKTAEGEEIHIESKCVLCATGGYGNDQEMMETYCKNGANILPMFNEKQTGDSIKMAWEAGAAKEGMGLHQTFTLVPQERIISALQQIAGQPNLWVNKLGERYCDETIVFSFPLAINALVRQPEATAFSIIDSNMIKYLEEVGLQYTLGEYFVPGSRLTEVKKELERGVTEGKAYHAETLADLARQIGCDPAVLEETISEYNDCCIKNDDYVMSKDREYMHVITGPDYYAVKLRAVLGITEGGIKINHRTEVIDSQYETIPGLYAGGCAAGGLIGDSYIMITSGGSLSFTITTGRIAAEQAAVYIKNQ